MSNDQTLLFSADASNAVAAVQKLISQQKALEAAVLRTSKAAEQGSNRASEAILKQAGVIKKLSAENEMLKARYQETGKAAHTSAGASIAAWGATAISIRTVINTISDVIAKETEYQRVLAKRALVSDITFRGFQVLAGMGDAEFKKVLDTRIAPVAKATAMKLIPTVEASKQLMSIGISQEQATGPVLQSVALAAKATNVDESDFPQFSKDLIAMIVGNGTAPENITGKMVDDLAKQFAEIMKVTRVDGSYMGAAARNAPLMAQLKVPISDQIAFMTTLAEKGNLPPEEAGTAARSMALTMSAKGRSDPKYRSTLVEIGGPDLIEATDILGEGILKAFANMESAINRLDPEQQMAARRRIFGEYDAPKSAAVGRNLDAFGQYLDIQKNTGAYSRGVNIATQGVNAQMNRVSVDTDMEEYDKARQAAINEAFVAQLKTDLRQHNVGEWTAQKIEDFGRITSIILKETGGSKTIDAAFQANIEAMGVFMKMPGFQDSMTRTRKKFQGNSMPTRVVEEEQMGEITPTDIKPSYKLPGNLNPRPNLLEREGADRTPEELQLDRAKIELDELQLQLDAQETIVRSKSTKNSVASAPAAEKKKLYPIQKAIDEKQQQINRLELEIKKIELQHNEFRVGAESGPVSVDYSPTPSRQIVRPKPVATKPVAVDPENPYGAATPKVPVTRPVSAGPQTPSDRMRAAGADTILDGTPFENYAQQQGITGPVAPKVPLTPSERLRAAGADTVYNELSRSIQDYATKDPETNPVRIPATPTVPKVPGKPLTPSDRLRAAGADTVLDGTPLENYAQRNLSGTSPTLTRINQDEDEGFERALEQHRKEYDPSYDSVWQSLPPINPGTFKGKETTGFADDILAQQPPTATPSIVVDGGLKEATANRIIDLLQMQVDQLTKLNMGKPTMATNRIRGVNAQTE
jgi:hypothetical protein